MKRRRNLEEASRAAHTKKMRFSPVRERKEEKKDEKTEGLGRYDAVKLKFMEASESGRERMEMRAMEAGG